MYKKKKTHLKNKIKMINNLNLKIAQKKLKVQTRILNKKKSPSVNLLLRKSAQCKKFKWLLKYQKSMFRTMLLNLIKAVCLIRSRLLVLLLKNQSLITSRIQ